MALAVKCGAFGCHNRAGSLVIRTTEHSEKEMTTVARTISSRSIRIAQALSGLALAVFVLIHLVNLPLAVVPGAYDKYQRVLRVLYQSPWFEWPLVIAPTVVHVAVGVRAIWLRRRLGATDGNWRGRLHRWSAWYLLAVMVLHVAATRGTSLVHGVFPESIGVAFALEWMPVLFWPYYLLLALAGVAHLGFGIPKALAVFARTRVWGRLVNARALALALGILGVACFTGLLGLGGALYAVPDPFRSSYAAIYRSMSRWPVVPSVPQHRVVTESR